MATYFPEKGRNNTEETAKIVIRRAEELSIQHIVIASNTGFSVRPFIGCGRKLVCVTHHIGFKAPGLDEMGAAVREELKQQGVEILTTTHLFGNIERAVTGRQGGLYTGGIISETLRLFSQGVKVAVEVAVMALDAGLIPYGQPVISVGGTSTGADSAIVIKPSHAKTFFDTEVQELICKPRCPKG